jgi:hypothetical protein
VATHLIDAGEYWAEVFLLPLLEFKVIPEPGVKVIWEAFVCRKSTCCPTDNPSTVIVIAAELVSSFPTSAEVKARLVPTLSIV